MIIRKQTREITIKNKKIGGNNPILIQSMTNTKTKDIDKTVEQIKKLEQAGCDIIRVCVLDMEDALAVKDIKKQINIPLVCDIHYDYKLAIQSILSGCDKIRLNPGNLKNKEEVKEVVNLCKERNIPIRIGVNSGSLNKLNPTKEDMVDALKSHIDILHELDFYNICISLKSSDLFLTIDSYNLASTLYDYPIHIGVTEAGTTYQGTIKSSIGLGILLNNGIGDTIRVSLTDDPIKEVLVAKEILHNFGYIDNKPKFVSCPTCGRCQYNMIEIANKIYDYLLTLKSNIKVAVMGCSVNGPMEARDSDIGIAGGKVDCLLFKKGEPYKKVSFENAYEELKKEIDLFIEKEKKERP